MKVRSQHANKKIEEAPDFAGSSLYEMIGSEMRDFVGKHEGKTGGQRRW
jgi:hypothetical protein